MCVEVGCRAINGVASVVRGEGVEVEARFRCEGEIADRCSCGSVIEVLQHVHADDEIRSGLRPPRCNIALLMTVLLACMFADIHGDHTNMWVELSVPVAPVTRSCTNFEHGSNRSTPPCHQFMHGNCEVTNLVHRAHGTVAVEALEILCIES